MDPRSENRPDPTDTATENEDPLTEDVRAAEKVVNAFFYYKDYGREKVLKMAKEMRKLTPAHQQLLNFPRNPHFEKVLRCVLENDKLIKKIIPISLEMFGDDFEKVTRITQLRRPEPDFMSKVLSSFRQLVREWTDEGREDRLATFNPIIDELRKRFPDEEMRHDITILCPGAGLGRLPYELVLNGFSVIGNECSLFMLFFSGYILNVCKKANEHTIYPYIFDKSNSWSYEDQTRAVSFPDICPFEINQERKKRKNFFGMEAGTFLESQKKENIWSCVVTAWFIDTANNILDYIEKIYEILKPGGLWINVGPLTYHFEDVPGEASIEIPYKDLMRIISEVGFVIEEERQIESNYTNNMRSMLRSVYTCAFFVAKKPM
ncbi:unnamed protein product [Auanema sp. JU1783]|nr:unnamed protein product [Auanema sp. JU1783]